MQVQSCDRLLAIVHQARLRTIVRAGVSEEAMTRSSDQLRMQIATLQTNKTVDSENEMVNRSENIYVAMYIVLYIELLSLTLSISYSTARKKGRTATQSQPAGSGLPLAMPFLASLTRYVRE